MEDLTASLPEPETTQAGRGERAEWGGGAGGGWGGANRHAWAAGQGVLELPWQLRPEDPRRQLPAGMPFPLPQIPSIPLGACSSINAVYLEWSTSDRGQSTEKR